MNQHDRRAKKALERSIRNSLTSRPVSPARQRKRARRAESRAMQPAGAQASVSVRPSTVEGKEYQRQQLEAKSVDVLKDMARERSVQGRSKMNKAQLVDAILPVL